MSLGSPKLTYSDACGEVPLFDLVAYNIERLKAIGYLERFRRYLDQVGLTKAEQQQILTMQRSDIVQVVHRAGQRAGWVNAPEAHLVENDCRLLLMVGERPPAHLGVAPIEASEILDRFAALTTDARLFIGVDPFDMDALRRDLALADHPCCAGFALSPMMAGVPLDDEAYAPCLKILADRGQVLWVHCSAHFRPGVPYDIGHPRTVDTVLARIPGLRIIMGHAGWPWTDEACVIALRYPSLALEFSTFPPGLIRQPGYSLTPLLSHAQSLKGRIFFGSGATISSRRIHHLLEQFDDPVDGALPAEWRGSALVAWMEGLAA
jgi:hypothetical protein